MRPETHRYLFRYSLLLVILLTTPIADALTPATVSYVVPVTGDSVLVPLCPAGNAFDAGRYPQNTPQSDPMVFECNWDGTGRVYISGERSSVTGIYADDGYTVTIQPSGATFDAPVHSGVQHPVVELTSGMRPGKNTFTLVIQNWRGLSMWYGKDLPESILQTPYIVQITDAPQTVQVTKTPASGNSAINRETGYSSDEIYKQPWTRMTTHAGWSVRQTHASVVMPDGSIILMGGSEDVRGLRLKNDVWQSTDNGATWTQVTPSAGWKARGAPGSAVMPDGTLVLIGGHTASGSVNDVWQSYDQGATWTCVNASTGWTPRESQGIAVMPDGNVVVTGGTLPGAYTQLNDVWRSTDKGATWTLMTASAGWMERYGHSTAVMPEGSILLTGGYSFGPGYWNDVWRSTDKGATWTQVNASAGWAKRYGHSTAVMPDGSILLMGGSYNNEIYYHDVWRSTDDGATWTQVTASAEYTARGWHSSVAMPDGSIVIMGGRDGSTIFNDVWRLRPAGLPSRTQPDDIVVTKAISPVSLKQGTDAKITITVFNRGPAPVYDIDIADPAQPEFTVLDGIMQYSVPSIESNDTAILTYTVRAIKAGSFRLDRTKVMYADQSGNYKIAYSGYERVVVLSPLIPPSPENEADAILGDLLAWFNGLDRYLESMIAENTGST